MTQTLWTAFETEDVPAAEEERVPWLTAGENVHLSGLKVPKRRKDWLLGRFTAKQLVSDAAPVVFGRALSPETFEIAAESFGAPFVRHVSGERLPLSITISHSHSAAFCALLADRASEIGGDLELLEPRSELFVRDFFTPAEIESWVESPLSERSLFANTVWSAKESVLKALGLGLRVDTRRIEVRLYEEPVSGPLRPEGPGWRRFDARCEADVPGGERAFSGCWTVKGSSWSRWPAPDRQPSPSGSPRAGEKRERREGSGERRRSLAWLLRGVEAVGSTTEP